MRRWACGVIVLLVLSGCSTVRSPHAGRIETSTASTPDSTQHGKTYNLRHDGIVR
jgi:uncharacterized protein YceK